ncbi:hypothetical protein DVH24_013881 [Malus domestica]|uniref:RNase H type-1 domain-containing protein n=1 Tax=Malus domestica TaxID=3750 RepID=A0A498JEL3_MALDO|nr:hypothetical protein DVH24_013881 [Malus domestica]
MDYCVKCLALWDGLWLATAKGLTQIVVESDSKLVIESISGAYNPPWRLKTILEDIRWLAESFEEIWRMLLLDGGCLLVTAC